MVSWLIDQGTKISGHTHSVWVRAEALFDPLLCVDIPPDIRIPILLGRLPRRKQHVDFAMYQNIEMALHANMAVLCLGQNQGHQLPSIITWLAKCIWIHEFIPPPKKPLVTNQSLDNRLSQQCAATLAPQSI